MATPAERAQAVLAAVIAEATTDGITLPSLRYVFEGPSTSAAQECEAVVASIERGFVGLPGAPIFDQGCGGPLSVQMAVQIWRCVPAHEGTITAPEHTTASAEILADFWLLLRGAKDFVPEGCLAFTNDGANLLPVNGGFGGSILRLSVSL